LEWGKVMKVNRFGVESIFRADAPGRISWAFLSPAGLMEIKADAPGVFHCEYPNSMAGSPARARQ
jgi:hypothetical protein